MTKTATCAVTMAVALMLPFGFVRAEEPAAAGDGEIIYVHGTRPHAGVEGLDGDGTASPDAARALTEPAFVTVVRVSDRDGETVSVAEALAESVGVNTRSLGGLGAFSSLSIRGASPMHTAVSVDGVPMSRIAAAAVDLGIFELTSFAEVEVYRGGVPVDLGGAALGGAVNFATGVGPDAAGDTMRFSAGTGSFGARHLRARWRDATEDGAFASHIGLGYRGADGDFEFFDDNGTPLNLADDQYVERTNNGFDQLDGVARARYMHGATRVEAGSRAIYKQQGVPGRASVQTELASLTTFAHLVDARVEHVFDNDAVVLGSSGYFLFEQQAFTDTLGEVGVGVEDRRYRTFAGGTSGWLTARLGRSHRLHAGVEGRGDAFSDRNLLAAQMPTVNGRRWGAALSAADEISLAGDAWLIVPGVRLDALHTDPGDAWDPILVDPDELGARTDLFVSPRLAVRGRLANGLVVKASAGRYFREPTLIELFGDRGFVVGNPTLAPETGVNGDVGVVFAPGRAFGAVDRLYLQAALFGARPRDSIGFVPSAGRVAIAKNLSNADLYGTETAATLRLWRRATLSANYTLVSSRQDSPTPSYDGKRLPLRPRHQAYARLDVANRVAGRLVVVWGDVAHTSGNFLDSANTSEVPARRFIGAGLKVAPVRGLLIAFEAKNLTNERVEPIELVPPPRPDLAEVPRAVSDVLGYPLPGRSFYLSLNWSF